MNQYVNCLVAFLDILGFKNIVNNYSFEEVHSIFTSIYKEHSVKEALRRADIYNE